MIDIKLIRENPDLVRENIKKKFQNEKLPLVDEVITLDAENRKTIQQMEQLRADRNRISKEIGGFMAKGMKDEAEKAKAKVSEFAEEQKKLEEKQAELSEKITKIMISAAIIPKDLISRLMYFFFDSIILLLSRCWP